MPFVLPLILLALSVPASLFLLALFVLTAISSFRARRRLAIKTKALYASALQDSSL